MYYFPQLTRFILRQSFQKSAALPSGGFSAHKHGKLQHALFKFAFTKLWLSHSRYINTSLTAMNICNLATGWRLRAFGTKGLVFM